MFGVRMIERLRNYRIITRVKLNGEICGGDGDLDW